MKASLGTDDDGGRYVHFFCPGCKHVHGITLGLWNWNEDKDRPTITPSILVHPYDRFIDPHIEDDAKRFAKENIDTTPRCHSFVTNGWIIYLEDSTHELAGQTVELPDWPPSDGQY